MGKKIITYTAWLVMGVIFMISGAQTAAPLRGDAAAGTQRQEPVRKTMEVMDGAKNNASWKVGAPAQPLKVRWVKGEEPVNFNDGKVHVIDFWSLRCQPCRRNMPHLSDVARKYHGEVDVISIDVWEVPNSQDGSVPYEDDVISFVRSAGDMMDYPVAMDTSDEFMAKNWLQASGAVGIPMAFIIDRHGTYAWSAPAFENLEEAINLALADKLDATAIARVREHYLTSFGRQEILLSDARAAMDAGEPDEAIRLANEGAKAFPPFANSTWQTLYRANKAKGDLQARAFVDQVIQQHSTAVLDLQDLARSVGDGDPAAAVKLLEAADRYSRPGDVTMALMLRQAYARSGDSSKAAAAQERAEKRIAGNRTEQVRESRSEQTKAIEGFPGDAGSATKQDPSNLPALAVETPTDITPMTIGAMLTRDRAEPGEDISVLAGVRLLSGWHTYAVVPADEPYVQMKWILEPGAGITASDGWIAPPSVRDSQDPRLEIYTSTPEPLMFMHRLRVADDASGEIDVRVALVYQACDFLRCLPPTLKIFDLKLTVTPVKK